MGTTLTVGSAPSGLDVTYTVVVGPQSPVTDSLHVNGSAPVSKTVIIPTATPGPVSVSLSATAPGASNPAPATAVYTITCT